MKTKLTILLITIGILMYIHQGETLSHVKLELYNTQSELLSTQENALSLAGLVMQSNDNFNHCIKYSDQLKQVIHEDVQVINESTGKRIAIEELSRQLDNTDYLVENLGRAYYYKVPLSAVGLTIEKISSNLRNNKRVLKQYDPRR